MFICHKQPSALAFDDTGTHLMFSNKYGDVHIVLTDRKPGDPVGTDHEYEQLKEIDHPAFLLGHCCAVVTVSVFVFVYGQFA